MTSPARSLPPELAQRREWTVDDLASLPPDLNYELINGRLVLPSPTFSHQDIRVHVVSALNAGCRPLTLDPPAISARHNAMRKAAESDVDAHPAGH